MSFALLGVKPGSDIETLFKSVGFVVVQWGFAEQSLDLMVASIFHAFDGHPSLPERRPQFLEPKVELLEKCFAEIPELVQFREESETLLPRFSAAGKKRNELVHRAISDIARKGCGVKYAWIAAQDKRFSLAERCDVLDVSLSGYRAWRRGGTPDRKRLSDSQMLALVRAIDAELKGAYGSPRRVRELRARDFSASRERGGSG